MFATQSGFAARLPLSAGPVLGSAEFAAVRRRSVLEHCKWDPQLGDRSTLAPFPVFISAAEWSRLAHSAALMAAEVQAAERELRTRPALVGELGLPSSLRRQFWRARDVAESPGFARVMRFDFHFTPEGWRVSEVNSDVPGGFCEAEGFTALMAAHFPNHRSSGRPATRWADRAASVLSPGGEVALLSAPGYMEDTQVVAYLASLLRARGFETHLAQPSQVRWDSGRAFLAGGTAPLAGLVRFYQLEWLDSLPARSGWPYFLFGGSTPISNPGRAGLSESKRFPLLWPRLQTPLPESQRLMPETRAPRDVVTRLAEGWVLKAAYSNNGDAVIARRWTGPSAWRAAWARTLLVPGAWVAQREFEVVPLATPLGDVTHCLGVYVIDGQVAGAYLRLLHANIIDAGAFDAALLVAEDA